MIWIWNFLSKVHMQGFGRQPVALLGHGGILGDESSGRKLGYWGHVLEGIIRTQTPSFSFLPGHHEVSSLLYHRLPKVVLDQYWPKVTQVGK